MWKVLLIVCIKFSKFFHIDSVVRYIWFETEIEASFLILSSSLKSFFNDLYLFEVQIIKNQVTECLINAKWK